MKSHAFDMAKPLRPGIGRAPTELLRLSDKGDRVVLQLKSCFPWLPLLLLVACVRFPAQGAEAWAPVNPVDGTYAKGWLVLGPFASDDLGQDFLAAAGGEAAIRPKEGDVVKTANGGELVWKRHQSNKAYVAPEHALESGAHTTAYAYCVLQSEADGEVEFQFGSEDASRVWVNGAKVFDHPDRGPFMFGDSLFERSLKAGGNPFLVKLSRRVEPIKFALRVVPASRAVMTGKISQQNAAGIGRALVQVFEGQREVARTQSDAAGMYRLSLFPVPSSCDVRVTAGEFGAWKVGIHLKPATPANLDWTLSDAVTLAGAVRMPDGVTPHVAVPVQAVRADADRSSPPVEATVLSDANGGFRFVNLRPGSYHLRCQTTNGFIYLGPSAGGDASRAAVLKAEAGGSHRGLLFQLPVLKRGSWKRYTSDDGLPHRAVRSICRSMDGWLWLGTGAGGLSRFDGDEFEAFSLSEGLRDDHVMDLAPSTNAGICIATSSGFSYFDGTAFHGAAPSKDELKDWIFSALVLRDGTIWLGTRNGAVKKAGGREIRYTIRDGLPDNSVHDIYQASDGAIWFGTSEGACRFDGTHFTTFDTYAQFSIQTVFRILQSRDGAMWFATANGALRLANGAWTRLSTHEGLLHNLVHDIHQSADGLLWFATQDGVSRYDGTSFVNFTAKDGLPNPDVRGICPEPDGSLWFATADGIAKYDPNSLIQYSAKDGFIQNDGQIAGVLSLLPLANGDLWIGTGWGGLFRLRGERLERLSASPIRLYVRTMHRAADGRLWIGTNEGIFLSDGVTLEKVLDRQWILAVTTDAEGFVWFSHGWAGNGISRYDPRSKAVTTYTTAQGLPHNNIWAILPAENQAFWLASDAGLIRLAGGKFEKYAASANQATGFPLAALQRDAKGRLWLGGTEGLVSLEDSKTVWLKRAHELPPSPVFSIGPEADNILWAGTLARGLIGYDGAAVTSVESRDGLAGKFVVAVAPDSSGNLWVGTEDGGLTRYRRNRHSPGIRLTSAEIDGATLTNSATVCEMASSQRLTVRYRAVDLKTDSRNRQFSYRLSDSSAKVIASGVTKEKRFDWTPPGAGLYTFEVRAIDRDLNYSEPARMTMRVKAPLYLNAWILVPCAGGALALLVLSLVTGRRYVAQRRESARLRDQMWRQEREARERLEAKNSELLEASHRLAEAKETADVANRAKSLFLANMSHEIRTPLNAILGYAQIVQRDSDLPAKHRQAIGTIDRSGNHLLTLINEILDLSKIESGRMELVMADFDLAELVSGLSVMFELRCQQNGLGWRVSGLGGNPISVRGDEGKLRQVLINLLGNAVKFTDSGEVSLRIKRLAGDQFRFEVQDTGPGIPPAVQEHIFEPFTQASEGQKKGGTGLGLAISRRQIELMGGTLALESAVGAGSRFHFTLTLPVAATQMVAEPKRAARQARKLKADFRLRVLVLDDIAENRDVLSLFLKDLGAEVTVTETGQAALDELGRQFYDIAFLDIQMPGMTGIDVAQRVLAQPGAKRPKLVAISASVLTHEQKKYAQIGFDDFVPKPFRFEEVCETLAQLLGVEFEYEGDAADGLTGNSSQASSDVMLPGELLERLRQAAEMYSVTEFEGYLPEVEATGPGGAALADRFRALSRNVQFDEILKTLTHLQPKP
jgi:signal transduction histidine kinase/streptogramin lyase/DNA-binding NarL/FixJ family response regulator